MNAAEIAQLLGGKKSGRQWLCRCPAHEDSSPSLLVFDGRDKTQVRCMAGCHPVEVLKAINALHGGSAPSAQSAMRNVRIDDNHEAEQHAALALRIWREAVEAKNTMAWAYLRGRGLTMPPDCHHVLRFHPACPRGLDRQPALVVLMRGTATNAPRAIQRIYLDEEAKKDGAMMLGPAGGCAMKITSQADTFCEEMSYCTRLYICEGFETGLALAMMKFAPIWALGSAGAIARFGPLFGVGHVVICADHDKAGLAAAASCTDAWGSDRADTYRPVGQGTDFADLMKGGPYDQRSA